MENSELLEKVKKGLSVSGSYNDENILLKALAVKGYLINAGLSVEDVESDLGITVLTLGVNDLWNLDSGEVKFSPAFQMILTQLQAVSNDVSS